MTAKKIIVPVTEPTEWVSALAIATKKSGELRVCVDPRPLKKALRREHYKLQTLDDVLPSCPKRASSQPSTSVKVTGTSGSMTRRN